MGMAVCKHMHVMKGREWACATRENDATRAKLRHTCVMPSRMRIATRMARPWEWPYVKHMHVTKGVETGAWDTARTKNDHCMQGSGAHLCGRAARGQPGVTHGLTVHMRARWQIA